MKLIGLICPFTIALLNLKPISECTANAKSKTVPQFEISITSPFGV
jgi:hypothetical protein